MGLYTGGVEFVPSPPAGVNGAGVGAAEETVNGAFGAAWATARTSSTVKIFEDMAVVDNNRLFAARFLYPWAEVGVTMNMTARPVQDDEEMST